MTQMTRGNKYFHPSGPLVTKSGPFKSTYEVVKFLVDTWLEENPGRSRMDAFKAIHTASEGRWTLSSVTTMYYSSRSGDNGTDSLEKTLSLDEALEQLDTTIADLRKTRTEFVKYIKSERAKANRIRKLLEG